MPSRGAWLLDSPATSSVTPSRTLLRAMQEVDRAYADRPACLTIGDPEPGPAMSAGRQPPELPLTHPHTP